MDISVDGLNAHAATGGREAHPGDPAVLMIHGAGMDRTVWQLQTRWLAHKGRRVLAVDLPGHGKSDGAALTDIASMADWAARFLDAAGIDSAAVVGHSMGALIALELTARHSEKVRALGLLGVAARMPVHPDLIAAAEAGGPLAPELICDWGFSAKFHIGGNPTIGGWAIGGSERLLEQARPGVLASDLKACDAYAGAESAAAKITCPTMFVLGDEDKMTPAKAARPVAAAIAGAEIEMLPGAGHMMMVEAPAATNKALMRVA